VSFVHGLIGPCVSLDTACSSSLVASHIAIYSLWNQCLFAAIVGTNILSEQANGIIANAGMLSALGRCHAFDNRGDGYCRGEGCGAFLAGSEILENSIISIAVQQDGQSASLTAPSGSSQRRLIRAIPD
ncbi:hypothetical protein AURANDRAFT_33507, partial [Aureococcus anophagefferens]